VRSNLDTVNGESKAKFLKAPLKFTIAHLLIFLSKHVSTRSATISRNCPSAASRSSTLSWARTSIGKVVRFLEAFVAEPKDIEAGFVAAGEFFIFFLSVHHPSRVKKIETSESDPIQPSQV